MFPKNPNEKKENEKWKIEKGKLENCENGRQEFRKSGRKNLGNIHNLGDHL